MRTILSSVVAMAAVTLAAGVATSAGATTFTGSYTESHQSADPGLVLVTNNLAPAQFSFDLNNVGDTAQQNLFQLYTNESSVDLDDLFGKPITVNLNFTQPDIFGGAIGGTTDGTFTLSITGFFHITVNDFGTVSWNNNGNTVLDFGNGGQLGVHLDDANFNLGKGHLNPGPAGAATITADFNLISPSAAVPEPASWALMIGGFGMAGAMLRRRRSASAVA